MTIETPRFRFDIVVWNHRRLELFVDAVAERIGGLDVERDRITNVSCSPGPEEDDLVDRLRGSTGVRVDYLLRRNRGIDQLARCEYFLGDVGDPERNLDSSFMFQMQEHYLDPDAATSRWETGRAKGDTVPDGVFFELGELERLAERESIDAFVADRNRPSLVVHGGGRYIAPSGGNFVIRTTFLAEAAVRERIRRVARACDNTYLWALYAEYMWGVLLFPEGRRVFDLARRRVFSQWETDDFYATPDDYAKLIGRYERRRPVRWAVRSGDRLRSVLARL
jgi:hypothetical protein